MRTSVLFAIPLSVLASGCMNPDRQSNVPGVVEGAANDIGAEVSNAPETAEGVADDVSAEVDNASGSAKGTADEVAGAVDGVTRSDSAGAPPNGNAPETPES